MLFRPLVTAFALAAVASACHREAPAGPPQERLEVFAYSHAMQPGQVLALRNMVGRVTVEPADDDTLRVLADLAWQGDTTPPSDVRFRAESLADGVLVCSLFGSGRCTRDDYDAKVEGSGISIGSGGFSLGMGGASQARVHFRVRVPRGVKLDLVLVEGDLTSASSGPVEAKGVNGSITVVTSVGPVRAKTVNGTIDVRMTTLAGTDSVIVETVNGNAYAFIPEGAAATVDVATVNGAAVSDFPGVSGGRDNLNKTITGVLGAGTTPVKVRAINGEVQLRRLDAAGRAYELTPR